LIAFSAGILCCLSSGQRLLSCSLPRLVHGQSVKQLASQGSNCSSGAQFMRWSFSVSPFRSAPSFTLFSGCLAYLQITIRLLQGIACTHTSDGSKRLRADLSLRCYGDFPTTAAFNFMFLIFYSIGFPCLCLLFVYRGTHSTATKSVDSSTTSADYTAALHDVALDPVSSTSQSSSADNSASPSPTDSTHRETVVHKRLHDAKRSSKYGWLYRDLKVWNPLVCELQRILQDRYWWYYVATFFITSFLLALQSALSTSISLRTFLALLVFAVQFISLGLCLPYKGWFDNLVCLFCLVLDAILLLAGLIHRQLFIRIANSRVPRAAQLGPGHG